MRALVLRSTLSALAMTLLVASIALGAPPTHEVFSATQTFTSSGPDGFLNPCTQDLTVSEVGYIRVTTFYDQAGNVTHRLFTSPGLRFTVTGPNGKSLSGVSSAVNFVTQTDTSFSVVTVGQQYRFTIPGAGSVLSFAGRFTFSVDFVTGTVTASFTGNGANNVAAYCTYLGAN